MANSLTYIVEALEKIRNTTSTGIEFWKARDLATVLGYQDWTNFKNVLEKAIESCDNAAAFSSNHFREFADMVMVGSGAKRGIENWYLSKYACYLIAMNGNATKPEIATAQTYFAASTLHLESQTVLTEAERRLLLRDRVKDANRKLSGAAKEAGVRSKMFGVFTDAGYKAMYDGYGAQGVKSLKGIPSSDDLLDCIGDFGILVWPTFGS